MMKKKKHQHIDVHEELVKMGIVRPMAITLKAVVVGNDEKILLLKRSSKELTNKGNWDLPGGHIDKGQTVEESLKREVKEEAGINVEMGPVIRVAEFEKDHEAFKQEKRGLRFIVWTKDNEVDLSEEHDEYKWLPIDEAIDQFSEKDGFEKEKKETLKIAKQYLEMRNSEELWRRSLADFENFRKRTERSNDEFRKFSLEGFINEMLPVVDNFEMATEHIPAEQEGSGWVVGIMHIKNQLLKLLEDNNVSEIVTEPGDEINEEIHEVLSGKQGKKKAKVKKVLKKGFQMGERVIRPAVVEIE